MAINRRAFLKSIAVGLVGAALDTRIDQILQDTVNLTDGDFITYVTTSMNLWISNPASCAVIDNIAVPDFIETETKPIGPIGEGMKYHFHCIFCKITFHLNFMPKFCLWCGTPATDPKLKLPNFIDIDKLKGIAKQIHDVQRTI
jgi:hypothetical protein